MGDGITGAHDTE